MVIDLQDCSTDNQNQKFIFSDSRLCLLSKLALLNRNQSCFARTTIQKVGQGSGLGELGESHCP